MHLLQNIVSIYQRVQIFSLNDTSYFMKLSIILLKIPIEMFQIFVVTILVAF